jgi:hypothetical protein
MTDTLLTDIANGYNKLFDENEKLRQQLTKCQAREVVLRDALNDVLANATVHFPEHMIWSIESALAMPSDSTALDALSTPNIPEGWKLVPIDPTKAMEESGAKAFLENHNWHAIYKGMLSGAPEYKGTAQQQLAECQAREKVLRDALADGISGATNEDIKQAKREALLEAADYLLKRGYQGNGFELSHDLRRMALEDHPMNQTP